MGHFCCRFWSCCEDSWPFRPRTGGPCSCTLTGRTGVRPRLSSSRCTHTRLFTHVCPALVISDTVWEQRFRVRWGGVTATLGNVSDFRGGISPACEGLDTCPAPEAVLSSEPCPPSRVCHHRGAGRGEPPPGPRLSCVIPAWVRVHRL